MNKQYKTGIAPNWQGGLKAAYQQFKADLMTDKDFIEFKKRTYDKIARHSYGVVVVRQNMYTIEKIGLYE